MNSFHIQQEMVCTSINYSVKNRVFFYAIVVLLYEFDDFAIAKYCFVINEALREVLAGYMTSQISRTHTLVEVLKRLTLTE